MPEPLTPESSLVPLASKDGEPVFSEPWQAQILALAHLLVDSGVFTASQWSDALGAELLNSEQKKLPDNAETYYLSALKALENLAKENSSVSAKEIDGLAEEWRNAYLSTPHGKPVELTQNRPFRSRQGI